MEKLTHKKGKMKEIYNKEHQENHINANMTIQLGYQIVAADCYLWTFSIFQTSFIWSLRPSFVNVDFIK